jgi:hypothetical protein
MQNALQFGETGYRLRDGSYAASISQMEMVPTLARPGLFGD